MLRRLFCLMLMVLLVISCYPKEAALKAQLAFQVSDLNVVRIVPLTIKVVFVGPYFDPEIIDVTGLRRLLPEEKTCKILIDENVTGVVYKFHYEFFFTTPSFRAKFLKFLTSIEEKIKVENPWFWIFDVGEEWFISKPTEIMASIYDARKVEEWLIENSNEFNGFPENGYTIMLADLRDLPSTTYEEITMFLKARTFGLTSPSVKAHYYKVNYTDLDRGYKLRYREFAVGWGGSDRFWFLDLSAGPTFVSMWYDLPIQVIMEDQLINPFTASGAMWLTELVADHIWEFIYNLAAPDFVYDPPWSMRFTIKIHVIDCRNETERAAIPIKETVNLTLIEEALKDLLPLSEVNVEAAFLNVTDLPELNMLIHKYSGVLRSWIHKYLFLSPMNFSYVDAQPIYDYIRDNLNLLIPKIVKDESEYVIPVMAFAFSGDKHFMFKYKWLIMRVHPEISAIWGVSFREFALIGLSHKDLLYGEHVKPRQEGKGFGFSQSIIHEVGHMLGLAHPHTYGDLGDFVSSAMSYFSYEYGFSAFDKDALARIHVDKLLMETYEELSKAEEELPLKIGLEEINTIENLLDEVKKLLAEIDEEYSKMNYVEAWKMALKAYRMAHEALERVKSLLPIPKDILTELEEKESNIRRLNESYLELKVEYEALLSEYEAALNELTFFKSLIIASLIVVAALTATAAFFAMRLHRLKRNLTQ
ncbi:MAG: hypothetical protein QXU02_00495 [Candidatus Bathyarchaeia archaeon]